MGWKKYEFEGESLKFEKNSGEPCETGEHAILWMKLCDILKNDAFLMLLHPRCVSKWAIFSECVAKNPKLMMKLDVFQESHLCAFEPLRHPFWPHFQLFSWNLLILATAKPDCPQKQKKLGFQCEKIQLWQGITKIWKKLSWELWRGAKDRSLDETLRHS